MPASILDHVRYPEDMFRVQTSMYGRYHLTDPTAFYQRTGAWTVAQEPSSSVAATAAQHSRLPSSRTR